MSYRPRPRAPTPSEIAVLSWARYNAAVKEAQILLRFRLRELDPNYVLPDSFPER